ncbi:MAG: YicC/YloC family endoribonuclease [Bacillota bacterium]
MLKSMTGYGREEFEDDEYKLSVEIKTVNHKYCNIYTKIPSRLNSIESKIKKYIKQRLKRGRIEVNIYLTEKNKDLVCLDPNFTFLDKYYETLTAIKKRYKIKDDINLDLLIDKKEAIESDYKELNEDAIWNILKDILDNVINSVDKMRINEGKALLTDLEKSISKIQESLNNLKILSDKIISNYRLSINEKIKELLQESDFEPDENRLEQEIAIFADKRDINEEITRIESHLDQFKKYFTIDKPVGKKLDFLAQELNREVNTIGAKSPDVNVSHIVVKMKDNIGKIREQVRNIE